MSRDNWGRGSACEGRLLGPKAAPSWKARKKKKLISLTKTREQKKVYLTATPFEIKQKTKKKKTAEQTTKTPPKKVLLPTPTRKFEKLKRLGKKEET